MINAQCPMFNLPQAARGGPLEISDCRMQNSGAKQAAMTKGLADPPRRVKLRISDLPTGRQVEKPQERPCGAA